MPFLSRPRFVTRNPKQGAFSCRRHTIRPGSRNRTPGLAIRREHRRESILGWQRPLDQGCLLGFPTWTMTLRTRNPPRRLAGSMVGSLTRVWLLGSWLAPSCFWPFWLSHRWFFNAEATGTTLKPVRCRNPRGNQKTQPRRHRMRRRGVMRRPHAPLSRVWCLSRLPQSQHCLSATSIEPIHPAYRIGDLRRRMPPAPRRVPAIPRRGICGSKQQPSTEGIRLHPKTMRA